MHPTFLAIVPILSLLGPLAAQAARPAPEPIVVTSRDGSWDYANGATVDIAGRILHGADRWTNATIYWPKTATRDASRFVVDVAADSFGNRQPWLVAFARTKPVLWVVRGAFAKRNEGKPVVDYIRRVDLANPDRIVNRSVVGAGPDGFVPDELRTAIRAHMVLPATNQREAHERLDRAQPDQPFEVLCRVRVVDRSGTPRPGLPIRFPVVLLPESVLRGPTATSPQQLHAPSNNGFDIVRAVTDASGHATALVPISSRARDRGASIHPAVASFEGATKTPIPTSELRKIAPVTIDAKQLHPALVPPGKHEPAAELVAHIVDGEGRPVAGHTIALVSLDPQPQPQPQPQPPAFVHPTIVRTDKNGRFALPNLRESERLRVTIRIGKRCATLREPLVAGTAGSRGPTAELVLEQDETTSTWSLRRHAR